MVSKTLLLPLLLASVLALSSVLRLSGLVRAASGLSLLLPVAVSASVLSKVLSLSLLLGSALRSRVRAISTKVCCCCYY